MRAELKQYIGHHNQKRRIRSKKASGIETFGKGIYFYDNSEELLKKLQIIVGEIMAGNTSIEMRNTGVTILDT